MTKPGPKPKSRAGTKTGTRVCICCKGEFAASNFYKDKNRPDGLYPECKPCVIKKRMAHYSANKESQLANQARYNRKLRLKVLNHYGHKCACCGEARYEFLAIDHVEGGGLRHLRQIKGTAKSLAGWLVKHNFPPGFRLLCHNCNFARGHYGYCPHDGESVRMPVTAGQMFAKRADSAETIPARWDNKGGNRQSKKTTGVF